MYPHLKKTLELNQKVNFDPKKSVAFEKSKGRSTIKQLIEDQEEEREEKTSQFKDACIIRFLDGTAKILNEIDFIKEFKRSKSSSYWKTIECIQTCIKSKIGMGHHIYIDYKVKVSQDLGVEQQLAYDYKRYGSKYEAEVQSQA